MRDLKDLKLKTNKELTALSVEDTVKELLEAKKKMFILKMKLNSGELKATHLVSSLRKYIARINTFTKS